MQLELVGCTGAGKSTLAARVVDVARAEGLELVIGDEFALDRLGLGHLRTKRLRAVFVHLVALWGLMTRGWRHVRFLVFACQVLRHMPIPRRQRWNQLRKVLKQLGRYEFLRGRQTSQTSVLVDEGTLHTAHNLLVHTACDLDSDRVQQFAERVPLPDLVIYVRQREEVLVQRTLDRGHPRITNPTRSTVAKFVRQAVLAFDQLAKHERIAPRMLVVQDGIVLSEPEKLPTPQMKRILEVLRSSIETETVLANHPDRETSPAAPLGVS